MRTYKEYRPTTHDIAGLGLPDRQDWLVAPVVQTRDSGPLETSNFRSCLKILEEKDRGEDLEVHRFGHWGRGWFEIILLRPESPAAQEAEQIENALADYCVINDEDFSLAEHEEADLVWQACYTDQERATWLREHWSECSFASLSDLVAAVRGKSFPGYASSLLG